jgi:hypothetical protein
VRHGNGENIGLRAAYWLGPVTLARQLYLNSHNDVHRPGLSGKFLDNMPESLVGSRGQQGVERRFYRQIGRQFERMTSHPALANARAFVFTDAPQVVKGLQEFIPGAVSCPKLMMAQGAGPLHQLKESSVELTRHGGIRSGGINKDITLEMFVELELLRRCDGLICMDSGFSIFAQRKLDDSRIAYLKPGKTSKLVMKVMNRLARR